LSAQVDGKVSVVTPIPWALATIIIILIEAKIVIIDVRAGFPFKRDLAVGR